MNRLRAIRYDGKRISQFELRRLTGIHQSKISMIECGLIQPTEDEKKTLAQTLGVSIKEIFPEVEANAGPSKK